MAFGLHGQWFQLELGCVKRQCTSQEVGEFIDNLPGDLQTVLPAAPFHEQASNEGAVKYAEDSGEEGDSLR